MKEVFVNTAEEVGCSDLAALRELVGEAARQQRSIVDAIVDSKLVAEEAYLKSLSREMGIPWRDELKEEGAKPHQLRKICTAQLALKHRLLPVWFEPPRGSNGDGEEDPGQGAGANRGAVSGGGAVTAVPVARGVGPEALEEKLWEDGAIDDGAGVDGSADAVAGINGGGNGSSPPERRSGVLYLATYDPFQLYARQAASQMISYPIVWEMASRTRILESLQELYGVGADTFEQLLAGREVDADDFNKDEVNVIDEDDEEASVVKFVNQIIREALEQRATDIHVEPLKNNLRIRYRVDGVLLDVSVPDQIKTLQSSVIARLKIMARLDIAERRLPQDGRINLQIEGAPIDVRVATVPTVEGESISLRLLGQERFTLEKLGLERKIRNQVDQLLEMSNGIVLITGPTGSGKSTTLYSFLSSINTPGVRIVTIEDPVENKLEGVMQIAVKPEINLTFANGLRSILRADPNIVMVGEIRDLETAEIAVRASLTGHLVFSTLHTNDSIGGISRLVDMGVEPFLVSASVRAFLAQRLVRRLCTHCRRKAAVREDYLEELGFPTGATDHVYEPVGCRECRGTGFHGRLAIYEVALLTPKLQDLIVHKATYSYLKEQAIADGFEPMREYGWRKVISGDTTLEEVISVTTTEFQLEDESDVIS